MSLISMSLLLVLAMVEDDNSIIWPDKLIILSVVCIQVREVLAQEDDDGKATWWQRLDRVLNTEWKKVNLEIWLFFIFDNITVGDIIY